MDDIFQNCFLILKLVVHPRHLKKKKMSTKTALRKSTTTKTF